MSTLSHQLVSFKLIVYFITFDEFYNEKGLIRDCADEKDPIKYMISTLFCKTVTRSYLLPVAFH